MTKTDWTAEEVRANFSYDPESGVVTRRIGRNAGKVAESVNSKGYVIGCAGGRAIPVHRIAWLLTYGLPLPEVIDHINGIPGDNRIVNLRAATKSENAQNRRSTRGLGKPKGVGPSYKRGLWRAVIYVHDKKVSLGTFPSVDEAAHAYNKAAIKHHGEFAVLNPLGSSHVWSALPEASVSADAIEETQSAYQAAKSAAIGSNVICPACKFKFVKLLVNHSFCSNKGSGNCKDAYWHFVRDGRSLEIAA